MRKPKPLNGPALYTDAIESNGRRLVHVDAFMIQADDTEQLIAWLQRALAWQRADGKRRGGK